ncbi:MAG TPA: hypothetical protein VG012_00070, partial [Acidimicrobiia bacterium]|nr:hypothetical protein [Acidimicrobiia bacterium]
EAAAGHEMNEDGLTLRDALSAETDGNPFFVLEILRHLAETGAISQTDDGRWVAQLDLNTQGLPVSVREVIGRRVHRLGPDATRALAAASVIGRDFDVTLLGALVDIDEDELLDVLDAGVAAAVIADAPRSPGCFTFVHALIQRALYDELNAARRQRLHRRVAEALETLPGDHEERVGELAHHWYAATQPADLDKAIGYSIAAGDRAQRRLAPEEAARWYAQALDLVDRLDRDARDLRRCELLVRLGSAQRLAGLAEFRQTLLDAADLAQRLGATEQLVEAALANTRGYTAFIGRLDVERIDVLRAALDAVGTSSPDLRARLLAQWALETIYSPEYDTRQLIDEALALTETTNDPQARWHALHALHLYFIPQNLDERLARQAEFHELRPRLDPSQQWWTFVGSVHLAMQRGDINQAREDLADIQRLAEAVGDPVMRWEAEWFQASHALLAGDLATAEEHANTALQIAVDADQSDALVVYGGQVIELRFAAGRQAEMRDLLAATAAEHPGIPAFRSSLAQVLAVSDWVEDARPLVDNLAAELPGLWIDPSWASAVRGVTQAAAVVGNLAAVRAAVALLEPFADQWVWHGAAHSGPVALWLGVGRAALGDHERAEADFARALALAERARAPFWRATTQLELARMLVERAQGDDRARAVGLLEAALETAGTRGFAGVERRARPLRDQLA